MFSKIKDLKKFTSKEAIDDIIGLPLFQIEDRKVYYYGSGLLIAYYPKCFRIEGTQRIEYGTEGEYAVNIYHFSNAEMLKQVFGWESFERDSDCTENMVIENDIAYGKTFAQIHDLKLYREYSCYMEGETRRLVEGKMKVRNLFITCGSYTLYFLGKSKRSKLSGFQYTLSDEMGEM